jgi:hypothetical protein
MRGRMYRLEVEGELGELAGSVITGMHMSHHDGNTVLVGPVHDQAELNGLVQRLSDLGVTLLSLNAVTSEPHAISSDSPG